MMWNLEPNEFVGIELPFDIPLGSAVSMNAAVEFPDTVVGQTYVYPVLYYKLFGAGISSEPRLLSTDPLIPTNFMLELGTTKVQIYLQYEAKIGPLGTLPRGRLARSILTLQPEIPDSYTVFGVRTYELKLNSNGTRVTLPKGAYIAPHDSITVPRDEAILDIVSYTRDVNVGGVDYVELWTVFEFDTIIEHDLIANAFPYVADLTPYTSSNNFNTAFFSYSICSGLSYSNGFFQGNDASAYSRSAQDNTMVSSLTKQLFRDVSMTKDALMRGWLVPARSKYLFLKIAMTKSGFNTNFAAQIAAGHLFHDFFTMVFCKPVYQPGFVGPNWRIPYRVYVHSVFGQNDITTQPWYGSLPPPDGIVGVRVNGQAITVNNTQLLVNGN